MIDSRIPVLQSGASRRPRIEATERLVSRGRVPAACLLVVG